MAEALGYIETHKAEVEAEYQEVCQTAREIQQYWEEQGRERFAPIAAQSPKPGQAALRAKLQLLESYVQHLRGYQARTREEVRSDLSLTWAIEHGLQLSIQCVIDVCHYPVADLGLGGACYVSGSH